MPIVPENTTPRINWYRSHIDKWIENAAALGLTGEQLDVLADAIADAAQERSAQAIAQAAARSATLRLKLAMEKLSQLGAEALMQIKTTAAQQGGAAYSLASIPPPADPSPISAPGTPTAFQVRLLALGWIELRWKCKNPRGSSGTMYQIERALPGQNDGQFLFLAAVGTKKFLDDSIPPGTPTAMYRVTAIRSTRRGSVATFDVNLGSVARAVPFAARRMAA